MLTTVTIVLVWYKSVSKKWISHC